MAKGRASFQKRERERQRIEKATSKRENRAQRETPTGDTARVATREDLDGYGLAVEPSGDDDAERS
jgi:hypothetical protein